MHQEETNLKELLEDVLALERPQIEKANVKVTTRFSEVPPVLADKQLLKQALMNLFLNGVQAMPGGGQLNVSLSRRGEMAGIEIQDTGRGITTEHKQRIFQLFYDAAWGQRNRSCQGRVLNCAIAQWFYRIRIGIGSGHGISN